MREFGLKSNRRRLWDKQSVLESGKSVEEGDDTRWKSERLEADEGVSRWRYGAGDELRGIFGGRDAGGEHEGVSEGRRGR